MISDMFKKRKISRHLIREEIRLMILNGKLPAGAKLVQQELGAKFKVAQGVIREALLELQSCGLVETIDNRGMFVSGINNEILLQSFDVREIHEGLAARLCCLRANRGQLHELREMAENIYLLFRKNKLNEMALFDSELHDKLLKISGNKVLQRLKDNYWSFGEVVNVKRDVKTVRDEHIAILNAIEDGNKEKAETLMRKHIANGKKAIEFQIKKGVFRPAWLIAARKNTG